MAEPHEERDDVSKATGTIQPTEVIRPRLTIAEADALTERIREAHDHLWSLAVEAYEGRIWEAYGLNGFGDYIEVRLGKTRREGYRLLAQGRVTLALTAATERGKTKVKPSGTKSAEHAGGAYAARDTPIVSGRQAEQISRDLPAAEKAAERAAAKGTDPVEAALKATAPAPTKPADEPTLVAVNLTRELADRVQASAPKRHLAFIVTEMLEAALEKKAPAEVAKTEFIEPRFDTGDSLKGRIREAREREATAKSAGLPEGWEVGQMFGARCPHNMDRGFHCKSCEGRARNECWACKLGKAAKAG